jgi:hypothetical protein
LTGTGRFARSSAWTTDFGTKFSARRAGSAAAWSPIAFGTGAPSSAAAAHLWIPYAGFDSSIEVAALADAAARSRVPLAILDVDRKRATLRSPESLLIVRPDSHIAWRGNAVPREPLLLFDRLRGAAVEAGNHGRVPAGDVAGS